MYAPTRDVHTIVAQGVRPCSNHLLHRGFELTNQEGWETPLASGCVSIWGRTITCRMNSVLEAYGRLSACADSLRPCMVTFGGTPPALDFNRWVGAGAWLKQLPQC